MKCVLITGLIALVLFTACTSVPTATSVPTVVAALTSTPLPTATQLPTATWLPTATSLPMATATKASTPTRSSTQTATATAEATATPQPTIEGLKGVPYPQKQLLTETIQLYAKVMGLDPEKVATGISYRQLSDKDGSPFVVSATQDGIPLLIAEKDPKTEWRWSRATPTPVSRLLRIHAGITSWIEFNESWNPMYKIMPSIYAQFDTNTVDGETQWFIPYAPNSSLRPSEGAFNFKTLDKALSYGNKFLVIQPMIPSDRRFLPDWLVKNHRAKFQSDEEYLQALRNLTYDHTRTVLTHIRQTLGSSADSRVLALGVASELPYNPYGSIDRPNFWREEFHIDKVDQLSPENLAWLAQNYKIARELFPKAKLYYTDFLLELGGPKANEVFNFVMNLRNADAPIDTVAFQFHLQGKDFQTEQQVSQNINLLRQQLRTYKNAGIQILATEIDMNMKDVLGSQQTRMKVQARAYYEIVRVLLEEGVTIMSFFNPVDNQYNWLEQMDKNADPSLFGEKGDPKPSYYAVMKALVEKGH